MDHRIISPIEMYSVARKCLNFYRSVVFYLRFQTTSFSLSQWKIRIEKALRLTIEKQERLRLQVDLTRKQEFYIILPIEIFENLPLEIIERTNDDDEEEEFLDKILEQQTNIGFSYDKNSPLWRLLIIYSSNSHLFDLIIAFDHAIVDGISGMAFFSTFIDCLSDRSTLAFSLENDFPSYQLISSKLPPLSCLLLKIIEKLLFPKFAQYIFPKTYWTGENRLNGDEPFETCIFSFKLSNSIVDLLHKKCHVEQTTIHCAIVSSVLLSITEIFGKKNIELLCNSAVNIRRFCQPIISNNEMGVFVSTAESSHYIPFNKNLIYLFWPLARQVKEQMNNEIEHNVLPLIQSLNFISNWKTFLIDQRKNLPNGYSHSVDVSNLLSWSFQTNDLSWKILHGGFAQSANVVGSALNISVVTVNQILKVYIGFQKSTFQNVQQVKLMKNQMRKFLIDAIDFHNEEKFSVSQN